MPNWCSNSLTLTHEDPAQITRAVEAYKRAELLQEFIPVPKELTETVAGSFADADEQANLEDKTARNIEKYGYGNWYDFCVGEWGTKWDVGGGGGGDPAVSEDGTSVTVYFDSAWAPPVTAYQKLYEMGFDVQAKYYEPGMCFAGYWDNGNDDYYEFSNMSADDVEATLPQDLDQEFNISETMREYEDEEPLTEWYVDGAKEKGLIK